MHISSSKYFGRSTLQSCWLLLQFLPTPSRYSSSSGHPRFSEKRKLSFWMQTYIVLTATLPVVKNSSNIFIFFFFEKSKFHHKQKSVVKKCVQEVHLTQTRVIHNCLSIPTINMIQYPLAPKKKLKRKRSSFNALYIVLTISIHSWHFLSEYHEWNTNAITELNWRKNKETEIKAMLASVSINFYVLFPTSSIHHKYETAFSVMNIDHIGNIDNWNAFSVAST